MSSNLTQQGRLNGAASAMEQKVAKRSMTDPATIRASETASKVALLKKCVDLIEEKSRSGVTGGGSLPTMSPQAFRIHEKLKAAYTSSLRPHASSLRPHTLVA